MDKASESLGMLFQDRVGGKRQEIELIEDVLNLPDMNHHRNHVQQRKIGFHYDIH